MRMYVTMTCLLVAGCSSAAAETIELETRNLLNGKIQMLIPAHFLPMDDEMLRLKYPTERRPTTVLTNEHGTVNVALNHTANAVSVEQLGEAHQAVDKMFRNLYPSATWYRSDLTSINGQSCFVLEILTPALDTEIHNIMVGTSIDNRMLLVSVNLTKELKEQWLPTAERIVESIKVIE